MTFRVELIKDELKPAMRRLAARLPRIVSIVVRRTAFDVVAEVAELVPVDTGRYRAGWRVSLDVLAADDGGSETVSVFETDSAAEVTVTNPVVYGPAIEYGTATRPPGNHLALALDRAHQRVAQEVLDEEVLAAWGAT